MNYTRPEVVLLALAVDCVESSQEKSGPLVDNVTYTTSSAYQADE